MLSKDVCWHYARYITILCIYIIPILAEYSFIYRYSITTCSASCSQVVVCQPLLKSYLTWFDLTDFSSVQCRTLITPSTDGSRHWHRHSAFTQVAALSQKTDWSQWTERLVVAGISVLSFHQCFHTGWQESYTAPQTHATYSPNMNKNKTTCKQQQCFMLCKVKVKVNGVQQLATSLTATATHMPYDITQCYLPPSRGVIPTLTPAEADTRFSNPGGMQGWVDLVGWLHTEMVYPP